MIGPTVSFTISSNRPSVDPPKRSLAKQVTNEEPKGKNEPDFGSHFTTGSGSSGLIAVTSKSALAPFEICASATRRSGRCSTRLFQRTFTSKAPEPVLFELSVAEQ